MLEKIATGLETMHDDARRHRFLLETGAALPAIEQWLRDAGLGAMIEPSYSPTFLHGGSSEGRWVVMGVNPGADPEQAEHEYKRTSPENYLAFHEDFFRVFPTVRKNRNQRWWTKLYRVMQAIDARQHPTTVDMWMDLAASSTFVVQDLIPFHGASSKTLPRPPFSGALRELAAATISGVARSKARGVFVLSRHGYAKFEAIHRPRISRRFTLTGRSTGGAPRTIAGYVARLDDRAVVALDNEFIAQPTFSRQQALPQLVDVLRSEGLLPR